MTYQPHQPDDAFSEPAIEPGLLDEALRAEPGDEQLQAKILELTDPAMLSLLDEALAPDAMADELTQRIIVATQGVVQGGSQESVKQTRGSGVLAFIGPMTFRYAAAAAIALAVGLGLWWNYGPTSDTAPQFVDRPEGLAVPSDDTTDIDWSAAEQFASSTIFDNAILDVQDTLQDAAESMDNVTINRETIWSDFDAYEQFLTDVETNAATPAT